MPKLYPEDTVEKLSEIIHSLSAPVMEKDIHRTLVQLRKKLTKNHTLVTKADKGNTIVLMDREDYDLKMKECLRSIQAEEDPDFDFKKYNDKVRTAINGCK